MRDSSCAFLTFYGRRFIPKRGRCNPADNVELPRDRRGPRRAREKKNDQLLEAYILADSAAVARLARPGKGPSVASPPRSIVNRRADSHLASSSRVRRSNRFTNLRMTSPKNKMVGSGSSRRKAKKTASLRRSARLSEAKKLKALDAEQRGPEIAKKLSFAPTPRFSSQQKPTASQSRSKKTRSASTKFSFPRSIR